MTDPKAEFELADEQTWDCTACGHCHWLLDQDSRDRVRGNDEFLSAGPDHSDICDCTEPLPMVAVTA